MGFTKLKRISPVTVPTVFRDDKRSSIVVCQRPDRHYTLSSSALLLKSLHAHHVSQTQKFAHAAGDVLAAPSPTLRAPSGR